jgi:hypothetical protein
MHVEDMQNYHVKGKKTMDMDGKYIGQETIDVDEKKYID